MWPSSDWFLTVGHFKVACLFFKLALQELYATRVDESWDVGEPLSSRVDCEVLVYPLSPKSLSPRRLCSYCFFYVRLSAQRLWQFLSIFHFRWLILCFLVELQAKTLVLTTHLWSTSLSQYQGSGFSRQLSQRDVIAVWSKCRCEWLDSCWHAINKSLLKTTSSYSLPHFDDLSHCIIEISAA